MNTYDIFNDNVSNSYTKSQFNTYSLSTLEYKRQSMHVAPTRSLKFTTTSLNIPKTVEKSSVIGKIKGINNRSLMKNVSIDTEIYIDNIKESEIENINRKVLIENVNHVCTNKYLSPNKNAHSKDKPIYIDYLLNNFKANYFTTPLTKERQLETVLLSPIQPDRFTKNCTNNESRQIPNFILNTDIIDAFNSLLHELNLYQECIATFTQWIYQGWIDTPMLVQLFTAPYKASNPMGSEVRNILETLRQIYNFTHTFSKSLTDLYLLLYTYAPSHTNNLKTFQRHIAEAYSNSIFTGYIFNTNVLYNGKIFNNSTYHSYLISKKIDTNRTNSNLLKPLDDMMQMVMHDYNVFLNDMTMQSHIIEILNTCMVDIRHIIKNYPAKNDNGHKVLGASFSVD